MPAPGPAATLLRPVLAGVAGALISDAHHARLDGQAAAATVAGTVAALVAGWVVLGAVLDAYAAAVEARRAEQAVANARGLRRANRALRKSVRTWRARAIHWQALYDREAAEADRAMLHTPFGGTLAQVHQLRDTRDRTS
jgi:hypothetical protein